MSDKLCYKYDYSIYLKEDSRLVAFGDTLTCARMLNMTISSFRVMVSKTRRGIQNKYEIHIEPWQGPYIE